MRQKTKAGMVATISGSKPKNLSLRAANKNVSGDFYYSQNIFSGQLNCRKCGSDYMKFSINGFCQDCVQRVEFIRREFPHIADAARDQNREAINR